MELREGEQRCDQPSQQKKRGEEKIKSNEIRFARVRKKGGKKEKLGLKPTA